MRVRVVKQADLKAHRTEGQLEHLSDGRSGVHLYPGRAGHLVQQARLGLAAEHAGLDDGATDTVT